MFISRRSHCTWRSDNSICFILSMATVNRSSTGAAWHTAAVGRQLQQSALTMPCIILTWSSCGWYFLGLQPRIIMEEGFFQWSLNLEHALDLLWVVLEATCLDTWCCRDLCFVSVWLLQVHCGAFPFQCRACLKLCPMTKRAWAKAVWGKYYGEKKDGEHKKGRRAVGTRHAGFAQLQSMVIFSALGCKENSG